MGAYLRKPITDKTSECGEYTVGERKFLYAATAMQGWRVAMEVRFQKVELNSIHELHSHLNFNNFASSFVANYIVNQFHLYKTVRSLHVPWP